MTMSLQTRMSRRMRGKTKGPQVQRGRVFMRHGETRGVMKGRNKERLENLGAKCEGRWRSGRGTSGRNQKQH